MPTREGKLPDYSTDDFQNGVAVVKTASRLFTIVSKRKLRIHIVKKRFLFFTMCGGLRLNVKRIKGLFLFSSFAGTVRGRV